MEKLPPDISELVQWMGQMKEGPLRLFLKLDAVIINLTTAAAMLGQLEGQKKKLVEQVEQLTRDQAEWQQTVERVKAQVAEEREHGRQNLQAFREGKEQIQHEADARLAQTQESIGTAQAERDQLRRECDAARHDLATIKSDVAQRLKSLQAVAE